MENFAENVQSGSVQVGTPAQALTEQPLTLSDVIGVEEAKAAQQPTPNNTPITESTTPQQEPGWFQGRLQKEQAKWEAKHEAEMAELRKTQSSLMERLIERDAQDMVNSGEVKSIETAKELLRLRAGLPTAQQQEQPERMRDANGRFVSSQNDMIAQQSQQRAHMLITQADAIQAASGVDVMQFYNTDQNVRQKILSGEWDFKDVLRNHQPMNNEQRQAVPAPIRNSSGVGIGDVSISRMTDENFRKMQSFLDHGGVINMRR